MQKLEFQRIWKSIFFSLPNHGGLLFKEVVKSKYLPSSPYKFMHLTVLKGVLRNFIKFTGEHLCQSLFLIKLQDSGKNIAKNNS